MIISTLLRCYALVVLLLCLPGFAHASIGQSALGTVSGAVEYAMPDWFKDSFLDIQEDINAANSQQKHVMLFFHLNECPYCQKMLADSFSTEPLQTLIQQHFDVIAINTKGGGSGDHFHRWHNPQRKSLGAATQGTIHPHHSVHGCPT